MASKRPTTAAKSVPPARTREDVDKGVRDCLDLMASGHWVTGRSNLAVAKLHGVALGTVKNWATSASRIIRAAVEGDLEDIRARMLMTLDGIVSESRGVEGRTAVAAIELQAKLMGLVVQKHEIQMTEAEAEALVAKAKAL